MNKIPVSYVLRSYPYFLLDIIGLILAGIVVQMSIDWHLALRQGIWALAGVGIFLILVNIPYKTILKHSLPFYGFLLALLILVKVAGHQSHGARRWIGYGPVMIQPSEFMKLALVLALVWVFGKMDGKEGLSFGKVLLATSMAALPGILIAKQPDLGTAIGLFFCLGVFLFLRGILQPENLGEIGKNFHHKSDDALGSHHSVFSVDPLIPAAIHKERTMTNGRIVCQQTAGNPFAPHALFKIEQCPEPFVLY